MSLFDNTEADSYIFWLWIVPRLSSVDDPVGSETVLGDDGNDGDDINDDQAF